MTTKFVVIGHVSMLAGHKIGYVSNQRSGRWVISTAGYRAVFHYEDKEIGVGYRRGGSGCS